MIFSARTGIILHSIQNIHAGEKKIYASQFINSVCAFLFFGAEKI